ncbi:MAG: double zinc ribbon domain-containing protein [Albimonas sp.]|uniref:double zinc ribbon domain-containing protein n=1 Tax=Albimonas sp. TaxID=1872425 RepID=UPI004055B5F4
MTRPVASTPEIEAAVALEALAPEARQALVPEAREALVPEARQAMAPPELEATAPPALEGATPSEADASAAPEAGQRAASVPTAPAGPRLARAGAAARDWLRPLWLGAADLLYPPQCTWCRAEVLEAHALCPSCWREATFISHPLCDRCGSPLSGAEDAPFCDHCLGRALAFGRARAAVLYEGRGRDLTLALKHGDRLDIARPAATWMIRAGRELLEGADLIAPTPLHWTRLLRRRFNQSAELARRISLRTGVPCCADLLVRTRATPMQRGLSRAQRAANQEGAFAVPTRRRARVEGAVVVLIDDVYASGATLSACAAALRAAGAARVDALCLARVAPEADGPIFSAQQNEGSE